MSTQDFLGYKLIQLGRKSAEKCVSDLLQQGYEPWGFPVTEYHAAAHSVDVFQAFVLRSGKADE